MATGSDFYGDIIAPKGLILPSRETNTPSAPKGSLWISGAWLVFSDGSVMRGISGSVIA